MDIEDLTLRITSSSFIFTADNKAEIVRRVNATLFTYLPDENHDFKVEVLEPPTRLD